MGALAHTNQALQPQGFCFSDPESIPVMPFRALTICRRVGCGRRISNSTHCTEHADDRCGWLKTGMQTARERGYGWKWQKLRVRVLERDFGLCQICSSSGFSTIATEVDHIIAKANGGTDEEDNLQAICRSCHVKKTTRDRLVRKKK